MDLGNKQGLVGAKVLLEEDSPLGLVKRLPDLELLDNEVCNVGVIFYPDIFKILKERIHLLVELGLGNQLPVESA